MEDSTLLAESYGPSSAYLPGSRRVVDSLRVSAAAQTIDMRFTAHPDDSRFSILGIFGNGGVAERFMSSGSTP